MKIRYLIVIISILFSCKSNLHSKMQYPKIGDSEYSVLIFNANEKYPIFKDAKQTELTHEEIVQIEEIIFPKISNNLSKHKYNRQYVAVINNQTGDKLVWVNFFAMEFAEPNWRTYRVMAYDGGDAFFQIKVNLTKKTYYGYMENGEA